MCPLCLGKKDSKHILLECPEIKNWRKEIMSKPCLDINEEVYRKMLSCTNKTILKKYGNIFVQSSV
jgi:hypothetical protein